MDLAELQNRMREAFRVEAADLLAELDTSMLALESTPDDSDLLNRVFRAIHTIKGSGATAGFTEMAAFTHHVEEVFDEAREGRLAITRDIIDLALQAKDIIARFLDTANPSALAPDCQRVVDALSVYSPDHGETSAKVSTPSAAANASGGRHHIRFKPHPTVFFSGTDPVSLVDEVRALGTVEHTAHLDGIPRFEELNPEHCYTTWELRLETAQPPAKIKEIFIFVEDESDLTIESELTTEAATADAPAGGPAPTAPEAPAVVPGDTPAAKGRPEAPRGNTTIRVDQEKLDRLMRVAGELLVARNAFPLLAKRITLDHGLNAVGKEVKDAGAHISRMAEDLQSVIMSIRMMPIRGVFQRFPRLVRDICRAQGKEADLILEGEDTELDRTVIEQIADPLVHLVRNAADHGLELPDARVVAGKPRSGRITLRAINRENNVVIEIIDDGRGMDPTRLKAKAVDKGLITETEAAQLDDQAALELIFLPGFSTAEKVTDISGRGVGMDVVRSNIRQLHGTTTLESRIGQGSRITVTLPASLMVSKGILVQCGGEDYILPMEAVSEITRVPVERIHRHERQHFVSVRNEVFSVLRLAHLFAASESAATQTWPPEVSLAITQTDRGRIAIAVDKFVSDVEVIVKPMSEDLSNLRAFRGATIMGDGRVVLVVNPSGLV